MSGVNKGHFKHGSEHPGWSGGSHVNQNGYITMLIGNHKYVPLHRLIMEWYLERRLDSFEIVHHCNEDRLDNRLQNLELTCLRDHSRLHNVGRKATPETKQKLREIKKGTSQKEEHSQWRQDITKEIIGAALNIAKTKKQAADMLGVCPDTLRARIKYYRLEA